MKINYSEWTKLSLKVANLRLDLKNPRLPSFVNVRNDRDCIDYLIREKKVVDLANKIVNKGYIPHEQIYVTREGRNYVVLEGNRRVSALKCLLNPELAPSRYQNRLKKLSQEIDFNTIEKIEVVVAPSRREADNLLFELHTEGKLDWDRQEKNAFIARAAVEESLSIEEIASRFNTDIQGVKEAIIEHYIHNMFNELNLDPNIERKALSSNFGMSVLGRIIHNPHYVESTGLKMDGATLKTAISEKSFKNTLNIFVTDIVNKKHNTRTLNKTDVLRKYVDSVLESCRIDEQGDPLIHVIDVDAKPEPKPIPNKPTRRPKEYLIPKGITYITGYNKLDILLAEGQKVILGTHVNMSAFLLRTIFELTIIRVFDINHKKEYCLNSNGRTKNLSINANALTRHENWFDSKPGYLDELKRFLSDDNDRWNSLETLNAYVHGEYTVPTKEMLQNTWLIIHPLIEICCENN